MVNGKAASQLDYTAAFFSAKITNKLMHHVSQPRRSIDIVPLAYFCGQHQDYQSDVAASRRHAPSLRAFWSNWSILTRTLRRRAFQNGCLKNSVLGDVGSILDLLARMLGHLSPDAVVFVIIDGGEHFSQLDQRTEGFCEVVSRIVRLFHDQRGPTFQLLFNSAQKAVGVEGLSLIMDAEIVNIVKTPPP